MSLVSGEDLLLADQGSQDHMPPLFLNACITAVTACMTVYDSLPDGVLREEPL